MLLPNLRKITQKNKKHIYKLYDPQNKRILAIDEGINSNKDNVHYYTIFWSVWLSQLLVSLTTSYISFFKWDKKYFLFNCYKTKINQEIWLFIELSGSFVRYNGESINW